MSVAKSQAQQLSKKARSVAVIPSRPDENRAGLIAKLKEGLAAQAAATEAYVAAGKVHLLAAWENGAIIVELRQMAKKPLVRFWKSLEEEVGCSDDKLRQAAHLARGYKTREELAPFASATEALRAIGKLRQDTRPSVAVQRARVAKEQQEAIAAALAKADKAKKIGEIGADLKKMVVSTVSAPTTEISSIRNTVTPGTEPEPEPEPGTNPEPELDQEEILEEIFLSLGAIQRLETEQEKNTFRGILGECERIQGLL